MIYAGPEAECRSHFGVRVRGVPFDMSEEEAAFVRAHLARHEFKPAGAPQADFKAATKPAAVRKK